MLGVAHLRNRRVLSSGFSPLGKEDLTVRSFIKILTFSIITELFYAMQSAECSFDLTADVQ